MVVEMKEKEKEKKEEDEKEEEEEKKKKEEEEEKEEEVTGRTVKLLSSVLMDSREAPSYANYSALILFERMEHSCVCVARPTAEEAKT
ncbi:hypothetical protein HZH68_006356 [Vespula germanica]|uniref:Uncharacterized protein n=1 Tax=Vespula germanica TaxID=30212 RepID=A0A834NBX3_VESGE|nr:hypothetical protein HZH68_006356 [Vespula germanica]